MKNLAAEKYHEHIQRYKTDPEYRNEIDRQREVERRTWWMKLEPFKEEHNVPALPSPLDDFYIERLIELGAIEMKDLEHDQWYYGNYRNSKLGKWDESDKIFHIIRYKWGRHLWDTANHFQTDDGFALFVPLRKATEEEISKEIADL